MTELTGDDMRQLRTRLLALRDEYHRDAANQAKRNGPAYYYAEGKAFAFEHVVRMIDGTDAS